MARTVASPTDLAGREAGSGKPNTNEIMFAALRGSPIRGLGKSCPRRESNESKLAGAAGSVTGAIEMPLLRIDRQLTSYSPMYELYVRLAEVALCAAHKGSVSAPMIECHRQDHPSRPSTTFRL